MKISFTTSPRYKRKVGLGSALKTVIHAGIAVVPLSDKMKNRIRKCPGCARRAARLDAAVQNINPFA